MLPALILPLIQEFLLIISTWHQIEPDALQQSDQWHLRTGSAHIIVILLKRLQATRSAQEIFYIFQ